jgi:hypothetical protein
MNYSMKPAKLLNYNGLYYVSPLLFFALYLLLPTQNSTIDAYGYANYIRDGQKLFLSHHLLYNAIGYLWFNLIKVFGVSNTLISLKAMNAVFASASLFLLRLIFKKLRFDSLKSTVWICFVGCSWGFMRFATENETYIAPILISLLASYFFLRYTERERLRDILLSGFFAAFACLVHQIHFFWWLALLLALTRVRNLKVLALYALPALMVPVGYILVVTLYYGIPFSYDSLIQFTLRDFQSGAATVSLGAKSIFFVGISFVRTFLQVHGYFANLILKPWVLAGFALAIVCFGLALFRLKEIQFNRLQPLSTFIVAHLVGFFLHLVFALISHGNAEFMVILPFFGAITLSNSLKNEVRLVGSLAAGMFFWNLVFGLIPLNRYELDGTAMLVNVIIEKQEEGSKPLFVVYNKPAIENQVKFNTGQYPLNLISATQNANLMEVSQAIEKAHSEGRAVYTDCLFRPKTVSRESLTVNLNKNFFLGFETQKIDSVNTLTGIYYIVKI